MLTELNFRVICMYVICLQRPEEYSGMYSQTNERDRSNSSPLDYGVELSGSGVPGHGGFACDSGDLERDI